MEVLVLVENYPYLAFTDIISKKKFGLKFNKHQSLYQSYLAFIQLMFIKIIWFLWVASL